MNRLLDQWVYDQIGCRKNFAYTVVDENLTILAYNHRMQDWFGDVSTPLIGQGLFEVIPELASLADYLSQLAGRQIPLFVIPKIHRSPPIQDNSSEEASQQRYCNLKIQPIITTDSLPEIDPNKRGKPTRANSPQMAGKLV